MKVVVTGSNGFIGSRVFEYLKRGGGHRAYRSDVDLRRNTEDIFKIPDWDGFDAVIHCAGMVGGIALNVERPADLMDANMRFVMNALSLAKKHGVKRFVNIGSVCAYPDVRIANNFLTPTLLWDGRPEQSNAPYGIAKRVGIELVSAYRSQYGMIANNLILANVYGPGVRGTNNSHVVPALIEKFLDAIDTKSKYVEVWGSGDAVREFLYVDDAARAIVDIGLGHDLVEPVNIGSGEIVRIRELVDLLREITGFSGCINWDLSKPDSKSMRRIDTTEAQKLGFKSSVRLEDGLKETVKWIANERNCKTSAAA